MDALDQLKSAGLLASAPGGFLKLNLILKERPRWSNYARR